VQHCLVGSEMCIRDSNHPDQRNLLEGRAPAAGEERVEVLLQTPDWRLERIHSCGSCSAPGFWYDQHDHEWILVLRGSATIEFADETAPRDLCVGDNVLIEAHRRHRVLATDPAPGTLWLALFWKASA
jgi:cupin 2 domain-containing protein